MPNTSDGVRFSLLFTIDDRTGSLEEVLHVFKRHDISLQHIESRPSRHFEWEYDFVMEFVLQEVSDVEAVKAALGSITKNVTVISSHPELSKPSGNNPSSV